MSTLAPVKSTPSFASIAVSAAAVLQSASLSGCSIAPEYSDPPVPVRAPTARAQQPLRHEERGALWRSWLVSDATVTVIHVRNHHLAGFDSPDAPEAAPFWQAQEQMFQVMEECSTRFSISALYGDGPTDKFIQSYNRQLAAQSAHFGQRKPSDLKALLDGASESLKAQGALAGFAIRHDMPFHFGENFELAERARQARRTKAPDADDLVLRQRENFLLSRVFADFPHGQVTIMTNFGADHYLWDNIQRWNQEHPQYKLQLIEVSALKVRELGYELPSQFR